MTSIHDPASIVAVSLRQPPIRIKQPRFLAYLLTALLGLSACAVGERASSITEPKQPNIIFILADDLGYGDLGAYGQQRIQTPSLDRMAAEGMRFTDFYAGSTVCAPSRSVLMTGQHVGHTRVRGNGAGAQQALRPEDATVAEVLQDAGYATALVGKWGLGDVGEAAMGLPTRQGFDHFFGYLNQVHAHNYYPEFLWRNGERVPLRNVVERAPPSYGGFTGGVAVERVDYSHDLLSEEALDYIRAHQGEPFFLYLALTIPHANNEERHTDEYHGMEVPDYGPYADRDWPEEEKGFAAMVTRMDRDIGRILALLDDLGIDENTVVMFSSDNGPHAEGGHDPDFFDDNGPLRGIKRDLYEGGIRVPFIARWPGHIPPSSVSDHVAYFGDFFATAADLSGGEVSEGVEDELDSISFLPALLGEEEQEEHEYLYWEFYERGSAQAVRTGKWKAVREPAFTGEIALYNVEEDIGEMRDVSASHLEVVEEIREIMEEAHEPSPLWSVRD